MAIAEVDRGKIGNGEITMIVNEIVTGIIAVVIGYLLGSIPWAYIAARLIKGKDIRQIGGGNVGARNVFTEVGRGAGIAV